MTRRFHVGLWVGCVAIGALSLPEAQRCAAAASAPAAPPGFAHALEREALPPPDPLVLERDVGRGVVAGL